MFYNGGYFSIMRKKDSYIFCECYQYIQDCLFVRLVFSHQTYNWEIFTIIEFQFFLKWKLKNNYLWILRLHTYLFINQFNFLLSNIIKITVTDHFSISPFKTQVVDGARQKEAAKIIGMDIHEMKSEKAKLYGITDFINISEKSISELIKDATGGLGVDYFFECTDVPQLTINEAIQSTRMVCFSKNKK